MLYFDFCEEYLRSIKEKYSYGSSRKAHSHWLVIWRLTGKANYVKENPRRKTDSELYFSQAANFLRGFNKNKCYAVHIMKLFLHQKRLK